MARSWPGNLRFPPARPAGPEDQLRLVLVVSPTTQRDVPHRRGSLERVGLYVVELQEGLFGASPSVGSYVGALAGMAAPDHALDRPRGLARARFIRSRTDNRAGTRAVKRRSEEHTSELQSRVDI